MKRRRVIVAYLLSPLAGAFYLVALWPLANGENLRYLLKDPVGAVSMFLLFAMIGYLAEAILATPVLCMFRQRGYLSLPWFLFGGSLIGIVVWAFLLLYFLQIFSGTSLSYKLMFGVLGCVAPALISTALFWSIVRRQITSASSGLARE
jgi:hypothetical protein